MSWGDLREFLAAMDRDGEVLHIEESVDPDQEVGAIWTQLTRSQGPIGLHERGTIDGYPDWRIASNLFGTFDRVARAFDTTERDLFEHVAARVDDGVPPRVVSSGPVTENVVEGGDIDLEELVPQIRWTRDDGGPFITAGHCVLSDPDYGRNVAWYRVQLLGGRRIAIRLAPHHQGGVITRRAKARGAETLDVAVYMGGDPAAIIAPAAGIPIGRDEYALAGSLRGEPLDVVECGTVDCQVPARAELVLEGEVLLTETVSEGPFGEFVGFLSDTYEEHPVRITRVAHRDDPVFVGTAESKPINETHVLQSLFKSVNLKAKLAPLVPEIADAFYPPESGGFFEAVVALDGDLDRPGIAKNVLYSLMAGDATAKLFTLVDDDIDVRDRAEVQWAVATRVQPERDIVTIPDGLTTQLDPSADADGVTDKALIDATKGADFRGTPIEIPDEVGERAAEILSAARRDDP